MSEDLQAGWDAAVAACLSGHDDCSYGGMTPSSGYWLAAEDCQLNHGDACAWCPAEAAAGFVGWGPDSSTIWGVPACREHADSWIAGHPEWCRGAEPESEASWQELLDGLNPFAREAAEDYGRRMDEALPGDRSRLGGHEFTGISGLMGAVLREPLPREPLVFGAAVVPSVFLPSPELPWPTFTGILGFLADEGGEQR